MPDITRRSLLGGFAALAAAPILGACGGGDDDEATPTTGRPTSTTTTTGVPTSTTVPPLLAPLTGLPWPLDPALVTRPALMVKISNADGSRAALNARPQAGFNQADVVIEILTEGGVTRLASIFHSGDAEEVGPVRSFRTSELDIVPALGLPLFAYSGANAGFLARLRESGRVVDVGVDNARGAYRRVSGRAQDQSLMASTTALRAAAGAQGTPPPAWFTYRPDTAASPGEGATPASGVSFTLAGAGSAPVDYTWDGRGYARVQKGTPHTDTLGVQAAPPNVIIQFAQYIDTGARDTSGAVVPEAQVIGGGEAWMFTNGSVVVGQWAKADPAAVTTYTDPAGQPVGLTPGTTWLAVIPPGTATIRP
jgi:hypothetical protein